MRRSPLRTKPLLLGLALAGVAGGGYVEATLLGAETTAGWTLARSGDGLRPEETSLVRARRLGAAAEREPTAEAMDRAGRAFLAAGDVEGALSELEAAARLAPGDAARAATADHAVDLALLDRGRGLARVLLAGGLLGLLGLGVGVVRARARRRRLAAWLDGVRGRIEVRVAGRAPADGLARLEPGRGPVSVDVFLAAPAGARRPPRPGPTLLVVFSHAARSRSVRLTPVRDLAQDAARVAVRDETRALLERTPGRWRVQARLDGRLVAESRLDVVRADGRAVLQSA